MRIGEREFLRFPFHILVIATGVGAGEATSLQVTDEIAAGGQAEGQHLRNIAHIEVNAVDDGERMVMGDTDENPPF